MSQPLKNQLRPMDLDSSAIGSRLQGIRKQRGMTQLEVANLIGITREAVAAYESGRVRLVDEMLMRFSLILEVSSDEILGLTMKVIEEPPAIRIMRRIRRIEKLPATKQKAILQTIDGFLKGEEI